MCKFGASAGKPALHKQGRKPGLKWGYQVKRNAIMMRSYHYGMRKSCFVHKKKMQNRSKQSYIISRLTRYSESISKPQNFWSNISLGKISLFSCEFLSKIFQKLIFLESLCQCGDFLFYFFILFFIFLNLFKMLTIAFFDWLMCYWLYEIFFFKFYCGSGFRFSLYL